mmetsp:Transcript_30157/g.86549  ORF Transcript_30157/g.86549 Transcript_30157/m.86549 type:complete len:99 (+) Transcript_30157:29-325(+)
MRDLPMTPALLCPAPAGAAASGARLEEVLSALRNLGAELQEVRQEMRAVRGRVDQMSGGGAPASCCSGPQGALQQIADRDQDQDGPAVLLPNWVPAPE